MLDKIAIISDIHGNMVALETVLADIRRRGIDTIYCLGDLVGKGPRSAEVVDRCRESCELIVRGNWDDFMPKEEENLTTLWHKAQLGSERLAFLNQLPFSYDFMISGKRIRLFHASQSSVYTRVYFFNDYETQLAMFSNTEATGFDSPEPDVVGYGDIHAAFSLPLREQKMLFNAGSVGNPLDQTLATYVIMEGELHGTKVAPFNLQIMRLPYDIEREIEVATSMNMPELEPYVKELRTGVYRGRIL